MSFGAPLTFDKTFQNLELILYTIAFIFFFVWHFANESTCYISVVKHQPKESGYIYKYNQIKMLHCSVLTKCILLHDSNITGEKTQMH